MSSRLDNVIAPSGSSAHHRLLAKEAAKRERDLEKVRRHLQQGIIAADGDFYVGTVLVKADALDQLEELRDRDLEAEFSLTGLPCRLVQISGQSGIVHLLAPDLAVLKSKRQLMCHYNMRLQAFHKDLFYEIVGWKGGNGPPVLLDGDDKKLPKHACLRLVVPDIIRGGGAGGATGEAPSSGASPWQAAGAPSPRGQEGRPLGTAPSTEAEVPEPTEQPVTNEPAVSQDKAQDLLLSGKEVWAATVSGRMVLLEYVRAAIWGARQPDIMAKLINPHEADVVAAWSQDRGLPRILLREKGEIYVSAQFLQAHCKKLSLEGSPRAHRGVASTPPRRTEASQPAEDVEMPDAKPEEAEPAAVAEPESAEPEDKPADAQPAEEAKPKRCLETQHREQGLVGEICGEWLDLYLDDKAIYDDARERVESGFVFGWVLDCEMIVGKEVTKLKELPKFGCFKPGASIRVLIRSLVDRVEAQYQARRQAEAEAALAVRQERARTHQLSGQDRAQVKRILSSGGEVWGASQDSERTVLFQKIRNGLSRGQLAPDLFAKLINPERDEELVDDWCETVGREPRMRAYGKRGEFMLTTEFVQAYCWELSLDNVEGQHHAEQAEPAADAKPAEAEDDAVPAPVADAKPAVAEDKPAEQADDNAEPAAAEDAKPAEEGDDKLAEQAEDEAEPAVAEPADAEPAAVADAPAPEDDFETLHGLRMRRVEGDWYELAARTLDEFEVAEKILRSRLKDKTFAEFKMKWGDKGGPPSSSRSIGALASSGCPRVGAPCFRKRPRRKCA